MTGTEYREQLRKIVTTLKAEGFSETNINLAILGERNAPKELKQRKEIVALRKAIKQVKA